MERVVVLVVDTCGPERLQQHVLQARAAGLLHVQEDPGRLVVGARRMRPIPIFPEHRVALPRVADRRDQRLEIVGRSQLRRVSFQPRSVGVAFQQGTINRRDDLFRVFPKEQLPVLPRVSDLREKLAQGLAPPDVGAIGFQRGLFRFAVEERSEYGPHQLLGALALHDARKLLRLSDRPQELLQALVLLELLRVGRERRVLGLSPQQAPVSRPHEIPGPVRDLMLPELF